MEAIDTLRAQYGAKQINTLATDVSIRFHSFIADESTVISAIYVVRDGMEVDVLSEITDNASAEFMTGVVFRAFTGNIFTKINLVSGKVVVYNEPNA